jgi:hypothetical protein
MMIGAFGYRVVFGVFALALLALGCGAVKLFGRSNLSEGASTANLSDRS